MPASKTSQAPAAASRPKPLFEYSSQWRHWRFTRESLDRARQELNEGAVSRVKAKLEEEQQEEGGDGDGSTEPPPSRREYLTVPDELALVAFYLTKVVALCRASFFRFPENVEATAMSYLKRFYLRNTCMDYHPKNVMLTCLFLATKTENVSISIDAFASRIPNVTPSDVLSLEFLVAQSLRFEFKVHHAHTAARGILLELQSSAGLVGRGPDGDRLEEAWRGVKWALGAARMTDAEFLYLPSQIAVAVWAVADPDTARAWVETKSEKVKQRPAPVVEPEPGATEELSTDGLFAKLDPLIELLRGRRDDPSSARTFAPIDKDLVTAIDRRLRLVRNPEKDPDSALFKKRKREEEANAAAKRKEKHDGMDEDDDPFGPPIAGPPADPSSKPDVSVEPL